MTTPQPASHVEFLTLGHRCRAFGVPPNLERWLRGCWEFESSVEAPSASSIDISFCRTTPWRSLPPYESVDTTALDGASLAWLRHATRWWSTGDTRAGVELRLLDDRSRVNVWDNSLGADERTTLLALHVAICEALRSRGLVPLHAAVIARDGLATAFIGPSGVGKSTTLLSAMDAGWTPIAEDFAWLDPTTRRVFGWGGDRGIRLDDEGLDRLPAHWRSAAWRRGPDGKSVLEYDEAWPSRPRSAELTRIAVLHRDSSRDSRLEPLQRRDATRALWEGAGVPLCRLNRVAFAAQVPGLLSSLEWARLVLGRAPLAA